MRIMAIEDESNDNKTTIAESDHKRVCRAATPSPTPENEPEQIVTFGSANRFSKAEKGLETERTYEQDRETEIIVSKEVSENDNDVICSKEMKKYAAQTREVSLFCSMNRCNKSSLR